MKKIPKALSLVIAAFLINACSSSQFSNFIVADKDKLMDGENEFRFISFNIPNLHYIEDYFPFDETNPWRLPDEFEIRDALTAIKQMGGEVARTYVITVKRNNDPSGVVKHVEAPGKFNEEAFRALDKVLEIANEVGIRLIIPFVDNWWWMGGRGEYAAFRGKDKDDFWTDRQLISDFKQTIHYIVNRENFYTGIKYKDDFSILGWETGNELAAPFEWQSEIAGYIKEVDPNHLSIINPHSGLLDEIAVADTNIDVLSTHYYSPANRAIPNIIQNRDLTKGKKPFFVGEFGFIPSQQFEEILDSVISHDVSGALLWSLRFRNRDGGFYKHYEQKGFAAYNWPGWEFNEPYSEKDVLELVKNKAHEIKGINPEPIPVPEEPILLETDNVFKISWQGSVGARNYKFERMENSVGKWEYISTIDESRIYYRPLFCDETAQIGKKYSYRLKAINESGESDYSNEIGPVEVQNLMLIDELFDDSKIYYSEGELKFLSMEDVRKAKEDRSRLTGADDTFIIYETSGPVENIMIDVFHTSDKSGIEIEIAGEDMIFSKIDPQKEEFPFGENDYGYFLPVRYSSDVGIENAVYVKITFSGESQLSRVELIHSKMNKML
ncbi:MAG: cellulase family glycosylhydrolase [Melioribacteraceae bacterium]|nr:cellulase family glycosylhydrolase [Melioribacteraceae bacterium]